MPSISLDDKFINFIKGYLKEHKIERLKAGKDDTVVSVIREGLFAWAEKEGILDKFEDYLRGKKQSSSDPS